jgi:hypothetical protein
MNQHTCTCIYILVPFVLMTVDLEINIIFFINKLATQGLNGLILHQTFILIRLKSYLI